MGFVSTVRNCEPGIESPDEIIHVPEVMKQLAKHVQAAIRDSPYPPAMRKAGTGVWRVLTARISEENKEMMITLQARGDQAEVDVLKKFIVDKIIKQTDGDVVSDRLFNGIPVTSALKKKSKNH